MSSRSGIAVLLVAALAAAGCDRKSPAVEQANTQQASAATADEVTADEAPAASPAAPAGKVDRTHKGEAAPTLAFEAPDGKPTTLSAFKGKPVLLNLWATWCAPCVKEMPTLDTAAAALGERVAVLTVAQDLDGRDKVAAFFAKAKFTHLKPWLDPKAALSLSYQANLPTTILYDAAGKELWRVSGEMDWSGPEAQALLAEAR